jgi:hypothetical protein
MRRKRGRRTHGSTLIMKTVGTNGISFDAPLVRTLLLSCALLVSGGLELYAQPSPGGFTNTDYYGSPLMAWSFNDTTNWTSDAGYAPVSFTNLTSTLLGDGTAVVVGSANPAWLQYHVTESSGTNNLKVDVGSVMLWFAPSWSGTNQGGTGPGTWGRLLEVGSLSSNGWWSLYVDPAGANLYFSAQTNGGSPFNYLAAPIKWTTNRWHNLALTYTGTNTLLYLDGNFATNGVGLTNFPGSNVLANGFFIGSDHTGNNQAQGMFDDLYTYNYPVDSSTVGIGYLSGMMTLLMNPLNSANYVPSGFSSPSSSPSSFDLISGPGFLQYQGASGSCVTGGNVSITNLSVSTATQPVTFTFAIAGGTSGWMYDLFASPVLPTQLTNGLWSWLGQGGTCSTYSIPNLPTTGAAFFVLGTPLDSDGDGLTDAYERLVSHSDPYKVDTDGNGMPDGWQVLNFGKIGTDPNGDPDQDGLTNLKEYLYGTKPQVSEGMNLWVGEPAIFVSIP